MKKIIAMVLTLAMVVSMGTACKKQTSEETGGNDQSATPTEAAGAPTEAAATPTEAAAPDPYEILFVHPGDPATDMDVVLNEFYARTKDTLNDKLTFVQAGWDDIGQKVSMMIQGGEKLDSAFLAQWTAPTIMQAALDEQLLNLDKYFNNDEYPGLKKAFSEEYLSTNKFLGSDGEYHVYGLPFTHSYEGGTYLYYRKDLADKYGITLSTPEDVTKFYDEVLTKESGMTPLSYLGSQDMLSGTVGDLFNAATPVKHNMSKDGLLAGGVIIKDDGTAYVSRSFVPSNDPEFAKYMDSAEPSKADPLWDYKIAKSFYDKKYVSADILNEKDAQGQFLAGRAASYVGTADIYNTLATQLKTALPDAELGHFAVNNAMRNDIKGQVDTTFQAWNFAVIPATCKDPDRVMKFYDWIFSSQENLDLFELGVEGKHWTAVGADQYKSMTNPDTGNAYNFGGFLMTWNPTMYRISADIPTDVVDFMKKNSDQEYFYKNITAGFSFNDEKVKTEVALINDVVSRKFGVGNGMVADISGEIASIDKALMKAGWEKYATEFETQFNEYLKQHPYEGQ